LKKGGEFPHGIHKSFNYDLPCLQNRIRKISKLKIVKGRIPLLAG
jgi:hypothetical protein